MDNNRKKLLWSVILVILYFLLVFYIGGFNVKDKVSYWNYKYNKISKGISKARELESFILNLI